MGEMADEAYDRAMDEAYGLGRGDDWGDYDSAYSYHPRVVRCARCGKVGGLTWTATAHGWRLDEGNGPHNCTSTDDFDILE